MKYGAMLYANAAAFKPDFDLMITICRNHDADNETVR
jgi:hypothetical protein